MSHNPTQRQPPARYEYCIPDYRQHAQQAQHTSSNPPISEPRYRHLRKCYCEMPNHASEVRLEISTGCYSNWLGRRRPYDTRHGSPKHGHRHYQISARTARLEIISRQHSFSSYCKAGTDRRITVSCFWHKFSHFWIFIFRTHLVGPRRSPRSATTHPTSQRRVFQTHNAPHNHPQPPIPSPSVSRSPTAHLRHRLNIDCGNIGPLLEGGPHLNFPRQLVLRGLACLRLGGKSLASSSGSVTRARLSVVLPSSWRVASNAHMPQAGWRRGPIS